MSGPRYCGECNSRVDRGHARGCLRRYPSYDDPETCTFCGHDINHHGTTQVGCADCSCGFDADFHPDPPRGDE